MVCTIGNFVYTALVAMCIGAGLSAFAFYLGFRK